MAEVLPENILIIDRERGKSEFASSLPAAQRVLSGFGSVHNLQLSRLWSARRFLIVEGDDVSILKQFQNRLFPETMVPIDTIPSTSVGGWGGWNQAVGSGVILKNAGGEAIVSYCIFDSDYFPKTLIRDRYADAERRNISLHIWRSKEIENYLLVPGAIHRAILGESRKGAHLPSIDDLRQKLLHIAEELKQEVIDSVATQIQSADRKITVATANQKAREAVANRWSSEGDRLGIIPGKQALSQLSAWVQETYKVSIGALLIAHHLLPDEIPSEIRAILSAIEKGDPFDDRTP
jgi:hypothetical protein